MSSVDFNAVNNDTPKIKTFKKAPKYIINFYTSAEMSKVEFDSPVGEVITVTTDTSDELRSSVFGAATNQLIRFQTTKMMKDTAGAFFIELPPTLLILENGDKKTWADVLQPMDFVEILFIDKEGYGKPLMYGLIDSISEMNMFGDKPNARVTIQGRDLGGYFLDQKFILNKWNSNNLLADLNKKLVQEINNLLRTDSYGIFKVLFDNFFALIRGSLNDNSKLIFSNGKIFDIQDNSTEGIFDLAFSFDILANYPLNINLLTENGNFWSVCQKIFTQFLYEFFVDTGGRNIVLDMKNPENIKLDDKLFFICLRPKPFNGTIFDSDGDDFEGWKTFDNMPFYYIDDKEIIQFTLSKSNREIYNYYFIYPNSPLQPEVLRLMSGMSSVSDLKDERGNVNSIKKFGYRPLEVAFDCVSMNKDQIDRSFQSMSQRMSKTVARWYQKNHEYLSGQIVLSYKPEIRIGEKIVIKMPNRLDTYYQFYVEGVINDFDINSRSSVTTLMVTRGEQIDINSIIEKAIGYEPTANSTEQNQATTLTRIG